MLSLVFCEVSAIACCKYNQSHTHSKIQNGPNGRVTKLARWHGANLLFKGAVHRF